MNSEKKNEFDFERPDPDLMKYYIICALLTGPAVPFVIIPLTFRYRTLRYKIDAEGISMRQGIFFRREVYLTYRRIQDIHVTRNLLERWMGLAKISLQTAAGSSKAELVIEGCKQPEALRDFLYSRMRGARDPATPNAGSELSAPIAGVGGESNRSPVASNDKVLRVLADIRDALRELVRQQGARP